jgi:hypothetical protein
MKSIALLALAGLAATSLEAQCRPPANSHEARLLAFYEAPLVFSMAGAPTHLVAGELRVAGGVTWLRPRFRVGFTDATSYVDSTDVEARLVRGSAFGGVSVRASEALELSGQVYSVPQDVTTVRATVSYRLRH